MAERWFALLFVLVAGLSIQTAGASADGRVQVFVTELDGEPLLELEADEPVYTASLVKLLVVEQLLELEDPPAEQLELLRRAIEVSDDDAMNQLWSEQLVDSAVTAFRLTGTHAGLNGQWGESITTARDYANVLVNYRTRLTPQDSARLSGWLRNASDTGADGFDQNFGLNRVTSAESKQGWMCCVDGQRHLHSAGVLPDGRVIVLLGEFVSSTSYAEAREVLNFAAQSAVQATSGTVE